MVPFPLAVQNYDSLICFANNSGVIELSINDNEKQVIAIYSIILFITTSPISPLF